MPKTLRWSEEQAATYFARKKGMKEPLQRAPAAPRKQEDWAVEFDAQIRLTSLPRPEREHVFAPPRKWRFDLAYPDILFACEVDGAVHRIRERFKTDLEKHQAAFALGWDVLRVSPAQVRSGEALTLLEDALIARSAHCRVR